MVAAVAISLINLQCPHPSLGLFPAVSTKIQTLIATAPSTVNFTASNASIVPLADVCSPATAGCYTLIVIHTTVFPSSTPSLLPLLNSPAVPSPKTFPSLVPAVMSAPPADPNCTILLIDEYNVFIYWVNDEDGYDSWLRLHLPLPAKLPRNVAVGTTTVFSSGRFYCISESHCYYAVDPVLPKPLVQVFEMEVGEIPLSQWSNYMIDIDGEVLLAVTLKEPDYPVSDLEGFQVYRPGLCTLPAASPW